MGRSGKCLSVMLLLSLALASTCGGPSVCEAKGLSYYFGSDSTNYLRPDNRVTISVDNDGWATVSARLHVKAYYPTGVGEFIEIPVPYPPERVVVETIGVSDLAQPVYEVVGAENQTTIRVGVQGSPREAYVEALYRVRGVYDRSRLSIRLLLSSFTTEVSVNLMISGREAWINRRSVELSPPSSRDTYFLVGEEVLPFAVYLVLSNVKSGVIELSLETQAAPYGLEVVPYYAMVVSVIPTILFLLITRTNQIIGRRRRVGVVVLAYRNLHRRLGRFVLTILGVSIPAMLLVQMLIQSTLAEKMLGLETPRMKWYIALILIISVVIGGFQVFNTVFSSVLERMRELGLMKAVGFNPSHIFRMVIAESALIGLIAGLLGSTLAAALAIISAQIFYGLSLPNTVYVEIVAKTFGGISFDNPFLRNYMIAAVLTIAISIILAQLFSPEYESGCLFSMAVSQLLFLTLLRPTDPFTVDRLVEIAPALAANVLIGVLFTVILSISAGSYVAYRAGKIKPSEAMRRV